RGALLPNISATVSGTRRTFFGGTFGTAGDAVRGPFNVFDNRGTLTQNLFSLSLIQRWRAARRGVEVAELDAEATKRDMMATVGLLYVEALRAEAAVQAAEANLGLNQQLLKLAQDRKSAGLATALDVTRAQVQLENEHQRLLVAQNERERAKLNLIRAIGIDFDVRLVLTDELTLAEVKRQSPQEALVVARANRVELTAQKRRERLAELTLSSVTSERLPSLAFNGDYGFIGNSFDESFATYSGAVVLSVPVFDGGQREGRIAESRSQVHQEQIRMKDVSDSDHPGGPGCASDPRFHLAPGRGRSRGPPVGVQGIRSLQGAVCGGSGGQSRGHECSDLHCSSSRQRDRSPFEL
ncbi:MAG: TolC family protein, partial [Nitrospirota bacterium]|nr:TolC family protein [Nitrospirota bacterium]